MTLYFGHILHLFTLIEHFLTFSYTFVHFIKFVKICKNLQFSTLIYTLMNFFTYFLHFSTLP